MRSLCLLLFGAIAAYSQHFSAGIKAGVPFTDFVNTVSSGQVNYHSVPNRYIIGVGAELNLPFGLGVELDALYRRLNYSSTAVSTGVTTITTATATTANAWEFPLLLKYRFPGAIVRPFIDGGVAWDNMKGLKQRVQTSISSGTPVIVSGSSPTELHKNTTTGFVIGAGLVVKALVIHLKPEIRYTRWGAKHFLDPNSFLSSNQNQAEFLLGIQF